MEGFKNNPQVGQRWQLSDGGRPWIFRILEETPSGPRIEWLSDDGRRQVGLYTEQHWNSCDCKLFKDWKGFYDKITVLRQNL
jgi:hypothetical protein